MIPLLLDASLRATFVAMAIAVVLAVLRVHDSSVRHRAWTAAVAAMLLMPVLPASLPALRVPMPTFAPAFALVAVARTSIDHTAGSVSVVSLTTPERSGMTAPVAALRAGETTQLTSAWSSSGVAVVVWAAGLFILVVRLAVGWRKAARLAASGRRVGIAGSGVHRIVVSVSEHVAAPMTVGVVAPIIVLPATWRTWKAGELRAVLLHERAHIERRDSWSRLVARVNCCIFWFHPIAWWLERRLAITAEHSCDDHVVRVTSDRKSYAQLLVQMSEAVQQHGGRVAWQGVGIGGGRIRERVDRVLSPDSAASLTRARKVAVAVACVMVLVLGFACQRQAAELKQDPQFAQWQAKQQARREEYNAAVKMTREQVGALEALVAQNPEDVDDRRKLLTFYQQSGQRVFGWNQMIAARRPHYLYLVARHPEVDFTGWLMRRSLDPVGYDQARALWLAHVAKPSVTATTLAAAADFFSISEKPIAEQLLLRAKELDPQGPQPRLVGDVYSPPWVERLGGLYAQAILASWEPSQVEFANGVRAKLESTVDAKLLTSTGRYLANATSGPRPLGVQQADSKLLGFDQVALGRSYLERARQLDSTLVEPQQLLARLKHRERFERLRALVPNLNDEAAIAALSETDQLELLPFLAEKSFDQAENAVQRHDQSGFAAAIERSRRFADGSIALARAHAQAPQARAAVFRSNITLAVIASRRSEQRDALNYMRLAVQRTGGLEVAEYVDDSLESTLTNYMLKAGERETVAAFLDRAASFYAFDGDALRKRAQSIREGRMPVEYQAMVTQ